MSDPPQSQLDLLKEKLALLETELAAETARRAAETALRVAETALRVAETALRVAETEKSAAAVKALDEANKEIRRLGGVQVQFALPQQQQEQAPQEHLSENLNMGTIQEPAPGPIQVELETLNLIGPDGTTTDVTIFGIIE